jgi:hypothetical protein
MFYIVEKLRKVSHMRNELCSTHLIKRGLQVYLTDLYYYIIEICSTDV